MVKPPISSQFMEPPRTSPISRLSASSPSAAAAASQRVFFTRSRSRSHQPRKK